jgi:hypothetical protein
MANAEPTKVYHDVERLEKKIDEAIQRLDLECAKLSGDKSSRSQKKESIKHRCGSVLGWILVMGGGVWLSERMGWFSLSFPWSPVIIILFGLVILLWRNR